MAALAVNGGVKVVGPATHTEAYRESKPMKDTRALVSELCRQFYTLGWMSGTGGSITIKVHDDSIPKPQQLILMSPSGTLSLTVYLLSEFFSVCIFPSCLRWICNSCPLYVYAGIWIGVQKERMEPEDMYVLSGNGSILSSPSPKPYPHKPPKCSDCAPLFMKAYEMRDAGAVIHSHGMESCLVTMLNPTSKEFRITHMEMIKGIKGHGYYDELVVPIIENTAYENELTDSLTKAIEAYPKTTAVLVRNQGLYVWGDSWINAKTQAECYHYLFDAAIKLHQLGLDWSTPSHGPLQNGKGVSGSNGNLNMSTNAPTADSNYDSNLLPRCIVLDIEGTTISIPFVFEVLFPYARDNIGRHLSATYDTSETQDDIKLLRSQVQDDLQKGVIGAVPIPSDDAGKEEVIAALVTNVDAMIKADRKITALKQLQGHIWRTGFESHELEGVVFDDHVAQPSESVQKLVFGKSNYGDLRKYLSGFFDTAVGNKRETQSYAEISQSLGVDKPSEILFVTYVYQEATAAKAAGLEVVISVRPGNGPLPENHGFKTINSLSEIRKLAKLP
ncbi:hypothetical protein JRO89_XS15G0112000 [Xanthoceras sorbifolium]|uniref:Probable bifunctional methylthioribulose-1-phosphate dehydratase/enolase-phosphatase E1 n=1 Tax=Xanthoceras sorbifolium TaxID=99658 RepID=A0ABQ8H1P5_9ROSI|nr:hypothetical protein JRO89_XS15G0112000 [Xanthoceras sorbifolium]